MKIRKAVGIDLGTTNSAIALLDPTSSTLVTGADEKGRRIIPSAVASLSERASVVVGHAARRPDRARPVTSVKRHMGLARTFAVGPETLTAPEVSACILRHLRELLGLTLNDGRYVLDRALITMPAYFNHNQIEATRQAGELAGFEVVELLHEPTAAALYHAWRGGHGDASYLVYDLGGGTFDVSIIRRRLGDYEVLGVSGDPFLGGDDFDRLLASHLFEASPRNGAKLAPCDPTTPEGQENFSRLVATAEAIKIGLSEAEHVERYIPDLLIGHDGQAHSLLVDVTRAAFQSLIQDKIARTIACCHEALARARQRCGIQLHEIDYVVLVGGSSRIPLVRETVQAAFCNPALPERVRQAVPLTEEPDLCVAYGAALRAATHGTCYLFPDLARARSFLPDLDLGLGPDEPCLDLELHLSSPMHVQEVKAPLIGRIAGPGVAEVRHGGALRITPTSGSPIEVFFEADGSFAGELDLTPESLTTFDLAICDNVGHSLVHFPIAIRQGSGSAALSQGVLPTQLITKPLQIEVLNKARQRIKQVIAPIGAPLPGTFRCTCRTVDQSGRIVVPIYEENRVIKQMVIRDLDPWLPVGSPVEVELSIGVTHAIRVLVQVRGAGRSESATVEAPPPPVRPTREEVEALLREIDDQIPHFAGAVRSRLRTRVAALRRELEEALRYDDEPKAIQRMAELRDVRNDLEVRRGQEPDPPWNEFEDAVSSCLNLAASAAEATGRDRSELSARIHELEAEGRQAHDERLHGAYRTCWEGLQKYAIHLSAMLPVRPAGQSAPPPQEEARWLLERFRRALADVWKRVKAGQHRKLDERLQAVAAAARGLHTRTESEAREVIHTLHQLMAEVYKVERHLQHGRDAPPERDLGLLEI